MATNPTPFDVDPSSLATKRFGGIDPRAVSALLDRAKSDWRAMEQRNEELRSQIAVLEGEKNYVNQALIQAEKAATAAVRDAEARAESIVEAARRRAQEIEDQHREAMHELQKELASLTVAKQKFSEEFRAVLKGYLSELDARFPAAHAIRPEPAMPIFENQPESIERQDESSQPIVPSGDSGDAPIEPPTH